MLRSLKNKLYRRWRRMHFNIYCRLNNARPFSGLDSNLKIRHFNCQNLEDYWSNLDDKSSPSRKLSNLFWLTLPWAALAKELGQLHILDIGCGAGKYGELLAKWSGSGVASYTGIDIKRQASWAKLSQAHTNFKFQEFNGEEVLSVMPPATNFIISQSAIEHFANDQKFFEQLRQFIETQAKPIVQVHLFPSAACLKTYGWHGHRQYTPRTAARLIRLFPEAQAYLFELGGPASNQVHYDYITKPLRQGRGDLRESHTAEYVQAVREALVHDMSQPTHEPSFYALVIGSNLSSQLFTS